MKSKGRLNCPNCGAPIQNDICEYCGTRFYDFGAIEIGKPAFFVFRYEDQVFVIHGMANMNITVDVDDPVSVLYSDNAVYYTKTQTYVKANIDISGEPVKIIKEEPAHD